jgi:hypothetical protein
MIKREAIVVLGMGRSGTSALARVLSLCGGVLPDRLLGANEGNPEGHWEPLAALELNEDFLSRHGSSWYDPTLRLQTENAVSDAEREQYVGQICEFLESCPDGGPVVLKEPRIAGLTEFWFEAARRSRFVFKFVIPIRHPTEVAASLAARDGASFELSNALWLKYNLLAERQTRSHTRVFVEYPNLLRDWRKEIGRVSQALVVRLSERDEGAVEAFLRPDLQRQKSATPPADAFGQPWIPRLYTELSAASRGRSLDLETIDAIFSAYRACDQRTFGLASDEVHRNLAATPSAAALG